MKPRWKVHLGIVHIFDLDSPKFGPEKVDVTGRVFNGRVV